jgi:hypothetical protein
VRGSNGLRNPTVKTLNAILSYFPIFPFSLFPMSSEQLFGAIGAVLMMMGIFMPVISIPLWGGINLYQVQHSLALLLLFISAAHLVCCVKRIWWALYFTKIGIILTLGILIFRNWDRLLGPSNPVMGLLRIATKVHWGVGVLAAGLLLTVVSTLPRPPRTPVSRKIVEIAHESDV